MNSPRRLVALSAVAALSFSACGGGSDGASPFETDVPVATLPTTTVAPATTAAPTTAAPTTAAPTTAAPTTAAPTTAAPTTAPPATVPAVPAGLVDYCSDVELLHSSGEALDLLDLEDPAIFRRGYLLVAVQIRPVLDAAPSAADAQLVDDLRNLLVATTPLINIDFDLTRAAELDDGPAVGQALIDVSDKFDEIGAYLVSRCGADPADLAVFAQEVADSVTDDVATNPGPATTTTTTIPPAAGEVPDGFTSVESVSGELIANVPAGWSQVDGSPDGELLRLTAAPDIETFLASYTQPGMFLLSGASGTPDAWRDAISGLVEFAQADGCIVIDTSDYDDGLYTGLENVMDCGSTLSTLHLIGGRNEDGSRFFLLAIVRPADQPVVRDEIVRSFFID
ncbi:MAG: hypothetical protein AB8G14_09810 [Ilumatobacter sp.]